MLQRRDYGGLREDAMAAARERARALAREGLPAAEINARLSHPLTRTEREVLTPVVRAEVRRWRPLADPVTGPDRPRAAGRAAAPGPRP